MIKTRRKNTILCQRKLDTVKYKQKRSKLIEYLQKDLQNCTTQGIPYIVNPDLHYSARVFWAIAFCGSSIFICYLLGFQFQRYNKNPTVMSVEMDHYNWNASYPAITLCPFWKTDNTSLQNIARQLQSNTNSSLTAIAKFLEIISTVSLDSIILHDFNDIDSMGIHPREYAELAARVFNSNVSLKITTTTNAAISVETAMTEVGMCHVINSNVAVFDNPLTWNQDNQEYSKKSLELSVYDKAFFTQINDYKNKFTIYIHSPDEIILISTPSHEYDNEGFLKINVKVWSSTISDYLRNQPMYHRKCRLINEPLTARYPIYSRQHCLLECRIQIIKTLCNCVPHFYKPLSTDAICNLTQLACIKQNSKKIVRYAGLAEREDPATSEKSSTCCKCLTKCDSDVYHRNDESNLEGHIAAIRVGLTPFPKIKIVREAILNSYDIFLRSGGVINLCIGTSIISLMEFVVVVMKIIVIMIKND